MTKKKQVGISLSRTDVLHRWHILSNQLADARKEVENLFPHLTSEVDKAAAKSIMTDLMWAMENTHIIGLHQIGEALEDNMGYDCKRKNHGADS